MAYTPTQGNIWIRNQLMLNYKATWFNPIDNIMMPAEFEKKTGTINCFYSLDHDMILILEEMKD